MWAYARKDTDMTTIEIFDSEAATIKRLAEKYDCCEASVVDVLFELLADNGIDIEEAW